MALKKLKIEKEREGFPVTSLREINMLLKAKHPNVVHVKVFLYIITFKNLVEQQPTTYQFNSHVSSANI